MLCHFVSNAVSLARCNRFCSPEKVFYLYFHGVSQRSELHLKLLLCVIYHSEKRGCKDCRGIKTNRKDPFVFQCKLSGVSNKQTYCIPELMGEKDAGLPQHLNFKQRVLAISQLFYLFYFIFQIQFSRYCYIHTCLTV